MRRWWSTSKGGWSGIRFVRRVGGFEGGFVVRDIAMVSRWKRDAVTSARLSSFGLGHRPLPQRPRSGVQPGHRLSAACEPWVGVCLAYHLMHYVSF
jgi:hypothetical protein